MHGYNLVFTELNRMPTSIREDAQTWSRLIANGAKQMARFAEISASISQHENGLYCGEYVTKRRIKNHLSYLQHRLEKHISKLQHTLEVLRQIQERTERMRQRVRMWLDDANLQHYRITRQLSTGKLHEFLQFLHKRYECEWEVKEMVVLGLENEYNEYDVNILLAAWRSSQHAGGDEFNAKLRDFYWCMGVRECPDFRNTL
ncbi:hypothetical protein KR044_010651 [Drosophila immigrans]|nr:hypothetical protein KR044_010651 [Drosophila immigrans]